MSNIINDLIIDRAREVMEECTNTMIESQLERAIADGDLELVQTLTIAAERHLEYLETINDSEVM